MTDEQLHITPRLGRVLMSEEAIYGLILVSGMIVVSGTAHGSSLDAFITVTVTVLVFFAAHLFAGTLGRLAATDGHAGLRASLRASARQSSGMLLASVPPLGILLLGTTAVIEDSTALWSALIADTVLLGALGWIAVARWSTHWVPRLLSAVVTAAFGGVLILLKAIIHH
ncbi:hypothetical protein [Microbacterium timonense]|jgi:hypothetical protein|uniref:hypothetical protein n=1 Tax=Microbacterium timonense TaxID=2086576 RepID=UPI000D0F8352|nr:hypothetical protein [Microbacterium timonense]